MELDPVKYEIFRHRLFNILEEGRGAMINISGSPVIAEGGECMTSIYDSAGNHILTAGGLLFHCTGCGEAVNKTIEFYEAEGYIREGDQFFYNDPYIAQLQDDKELLNSVELTRECLSSMDCVIIATDHSTYDYQYIIDNASLVFDTRGVTRTIRSKNIFRLGE